MEKPDPKELGIPNINFSCEVKDAERQKKFKEQRINRGFDDSECWSLDIVIAEFITPRLIVFKENKAGYPTCCHSKEEWDDILDKMIRAFQTISGDTIHEPHEEVREGLDLFRKYYHNLWS